MPCIPGWIVKRLLPGIRTPLGTARGRAGVGVRKVWVGCAQGKRDSPGRDAYTRAVKVEQDGELFYWPASPLPPSPSKGPKDLPSSQQRAAVWPKRTQPFLSRAGGGGHPFPPVAGPVVAPGRTTTACVAGAHGERGAGGRVGGLPPGVDRVNPGSQEPPGTDSGSYCRLTRRTGTVGFPPPAPFQSIKLSLMLGAKHFG